MVWGAAGEALGAPRASTAFRLRLPLLVRSWRPADSNGLEHFRAGLYGAADAGIKSGSGAYIAAGDRHRWHRHAA